MDDRTNILLRIAIGILLPIILIALGLFHILNLKIVIATIGWVLAIYVFHSINMRQDERTKRLNAYAVNLSWFFTICFLSVFFFIDQLKIVELSSEHVIGLIFFFMAYSYWIIKFVVSGRSDVPE
jgi:hypothetical protein